MAKKEPKLWEQQDGEPLRGFRFFCLYKDMMNRSLVGLGTLMGKKSSRTFEKYSSRWQWQKRVKAWDAELDRLLLSRQSKTIGDMQSRHINIGLGMQTAAAKELQALVHKIEKADAKAKEKARVDAMNAGKDPPEVAKIVAATHHDPVITISELVRLSEHGLNIERLNRGEPTDHTRTDALEDLSGLSKEELKLVKRLKAKITKL